MQLFDGKLWRCTHMAAGCAAGFCNASEGKDYFDLFQEKGASIQNIFSANHLSDKTSQCKRCLFPQGKVIPTAVQVSATS